MAEAVGGTSERLRQQPPTPSQAATASGPADITVPNPAATVTATAAAGDLHLIFTASSFPHDVDLAETVNQACGLKYFKNYS
jgi:hypothetical protein